MKVPHVRQILKALRDPDEGLKGDKALDDFISFVNFAIGGHPCLLRAFVSVLSEAGYKSLQRDHTTKPDGEVNEENEEGRQTGGRKGEDDEQGPVIAIQNMDEQCMDIDEEEIGEAKQGGNMNIVAKLPRRRAEFTESDKQDLGPQFYIEGYDAFFDQELYADIDRRWRLVKDTWSKVQLRQFPEISGGILQSDGMSYLPQLLVY